MEISLIAISSKLIKSWVCCKMGKIKMTNGKRINMGIGWNKIANYNNKFYTERQNNQTSLAELFVKGHVNGVLIGNLNYWGASDPFGVT